MKTKTLVVLGLIGAFTVPVFRSGGRDNLTLVQFILNHTIWGPPIEYVPEEDYEKMLADRM